MPDPRFKHLNVFEVADEDRLWTVRCSLETLAELFESPRKWMSDLTLHAREVGEIQKDDRLWTQDVLTIRMSPVLEGHARGFDVLLNRSPEENLELLQGLFMLGVTDAADVRDALAEAAAAPTTVVMGLNGTGYISIEPSPVSTLGTFLTNSDWDAYWKEWTCQTPVALTVLPEDERAMLHLDLTKHDDLDKGKKLAAFMVGGSRAPTRMNALHEGARCRWGDPHMPKPGAKPHDPKDARFGPLDDKALAAMTFLYISDLNDFKEACEVTAGQYDPETQTITPQSIAAKDYARTTKPLPAAPKTGDEDGPGGALR